MSEHFVAPASHFHALPDSISLETASLIEPLGVAWHAVMQISPFERGNNVLVLGAGPVGLNVIQVLALHGCNKIFVAEINENRKKLATYFGATHVLDSHQMDVVESVRFLTNDVGADVVYDTEGWRACSTTLPSPHVARVQPLSTSPCGGKVRVLT
jgi:threonine dehydrogenase-like Zn-dependent dehydrogenase